jgi:hypothetical protein
MHFDSRIRRYPTSNRRGYRKESSLKLYIGGFRGKDPDFDQKLALAKEVGDTRVIITDFNPKNKKIYNVGDRAYVAFDPENVHVL